MENRSEVQCRACSAPSAAGVAFCAACGAAMEIFCLHCSIGNPPDSRFCRRCGRALATNGNAPSAGAAASMPESVADGRYRVERFLGEGGRKRVYVAHDTRLDRDVALALVKTEGLDEAGRNRVQREAQAMARLGDHPHIVSVHDIGEDHGQIYIVSQFMAGGDLESALATHPQRRLPVGEALRIADQICDALAHAHRRGVVHRDLKPGNVWLAADGTAKLGDFGLALSLQNTRLTAEGGLVGTVAYMSPEQALGRTPDRRSDLYSLGALLYEILTGRPPFLGDDAVAVITQHLETAPVAPSWHNPEIPPALEALVLRLLAKVPEDRPPDAQSVREMVAAIRSQAAAPPAAPSANPLDRLAGGVFVGRAREIEELRSALDDALGGKGRLVMLVGEPGIGKTRTAEEVATYARLRSAGVLIGRCYEGEGAPAYWPWLQIIRAYLQEDRSETLRADMGAGAADIAQMLPELRERLPDLPTPPALDPEQARFRLFDSVTAFVKNVAQRQPLVIFIDDLHWADKPSLLLLQFVARELRNARILLLAAYRDVELRRDHPLAQALGELAREQLSQRVILRGLTESDIARFVEMTAGKKAPRALVAAVYEQTEGNPFFVNEVVRLLVSEKHLERAEEAGVWQVAIPQSVREVIGRRLDRLSKETNQILAIAAVIGREFSINVLEQVREQSLNVFERVGEIFRDRLLEAMEEATAARIVAEIPHAVGRYSFSHALIRETLYGELPTTRRVRLHRQVGEVLERLYESNVEAHLDELAHHFFEAAAGGNIAKSIDYATRAGDRALALLAYEEAAEHYERALQALELKEGAGDPERCDLLLALAEAQLKAGDTRKAQESFHRAAAVARSSGDPQRLTRAALGLSTSDISIGVADRALITLLEETLGVLPPGDSAMRARVLARLSIDLYWSEERQRGIELSQEALAMARRVGDPVALVDGLTARHIALWRAEDVQDVLAGGSEILRLAREAGDFDRILMGRAWRAHALLTLGDIQGVDREIEAAARLAEEVRQPLYRWILLTWRAMLALLQGRFAEAEELAEEALVVGRRVQPNDAPQAYAVQILLLRREQGRLREIEQIVREFGEQYPTLPAWQCGLAYLHSQSGRREDARQHIERLAAHDFADLPQDLFWPIAVTLLAEASIALGESKYARRLYALLLPYAGRNVVVGTGVVCIGSASRTLGGLAALLKRWKEAERHFEDAIDMHARMGAQPFLAQTQVQYGEMLLARSARRDRDRALELASRALEIAQRLGMRIVAERATSLRLRAQGIDPPALRTSIEAVVSAVGTEPLDLGNARAADGTVTMMFSDIEGFTAMTEKLGDQGVQEVLRAHNAIIRRRVAECGGMEVKSQGDGFMLAFPDPERAVRCAIAVQRDLEAYNATHENTRIRVRIGLHSGPAIREADDFFGKNVILASRIAAHARAGEILVSAQLRDLLAEEPDLRFGRKHRVKLKGLAGTYVVHRVRWRQSGADA